MRDRALDDYDATIKLDPRLTAAYAASARLREDKGERDHAIHDFDMAVRLDPNEVNLLYDRGNTRARPVTGVARLLTTIARWFSLRRKPKRTSLAVGPGFARGSKEPISMPLCT